MRFIHQYRRLVTKSKKLIIKTIASVGKSFLGEKNLINSMKNKIFIWVMVTTSYHTFAKTIKIRSAYSV